jgi:AraC family transcriptional regulator
MNLPAFPISQRALAGVLASDLDAGRCHDVRSMETPTLNAMVVDYHRDCDVAGDWYSDKLHYFDMSLAARPASSRGCFSDLQQEPETLGKIFFAPAGYRLHAEGGQGRQHTLFVFMRTQPLFPDEELEEVLSPVIRTCLKVRNDTVRDVLARIGAEVCAPSFASELLVEGLGLTLLAESARMIRTLSADAVRKGGLSPWRMRLIEERVRTARTLPSLAELSELCGLSRRQLMRAFREETGQTIGSFIQALTVERAKALLSDTDMPVGVVAGEVGFATAAAFSVAFRRATGQTPRSFRSRLTGRAARRLTHA